MSHQHLDFLPKHPAVSIIVWQHYKFSQVLNETTNSCPWVCIWQNCNHFIFVFSTSLYHSRKSFSSVQFSHSVVSDSLRPHESQPGRPPCPSPTPGVHPNPGPSSQWCHPAFSSSLVPFSSCPQSLPASESFPMSQLFASGGQRIVVSASTSVLQWTPRTDLL